MQVVEIVFEGIIQNAHYWRKVETVESIPLVGQLRAEEPEPVPQVAEQWMQRFKEKFPRNMHVYEEVLSSERLKELQRIAKGDVETITIPKDLWAEIVAGEYRGRAQRLQPPWLPSHMPPSCFR